MFIAFFHFLCMYVLAGTFIRLFTMKFPDNPVASALMFAH